MTEIYEWSLKRAVLAAEPGNTADDIPLTNNQITYTVGRSRENNIVFISDLVSKKHCLFFRNENNLFIQDLKSVNGVFINGRKQNSQIMVPLKDGDIIGFGTNEKVSTDLQKFVFKVKKQAIIDLERENVKMELQSSNCEEEIHQPMNKLLKFSESEQKVQNLNLAVSNFQLRDEILKHKTPSTVSEEIFGTSSSVKMGFEISVSKGYKGPMPNIFLNQMPLTSSSNALQISLDQAVIKENQSGASGWSQSPLQASNFHIGAKIPETVCSKREFSSINKNVSSENSQFRVTEISRRNSFPLNSTINKESSSSDKEVSTSPISIEERQEVQKSKQVDLPKEVEKPKESTEPQMHQQRPDSTNAENEKIVSNSSTDSDTSTMLCTSTTNTSRSKTSEVKRNQDVDLNLKSTNKKSFTVIQRNASGERREVLRFIDESSNSKENREILKGKDPTISTQKKRENRQDLGWKNSDIIVEESESDEDENEVDKNSNLDISSSEIEWLQRENERFIKNSIPPMGPRTCNSNNNRQATSHETNCSMNVNQGEINSAWEKAVKAIASLQNTPYLQPNPFSSSQFAYPIHPRSYSNPQNLYPNHYVYPNNQYLYPNYQMENYLNPHQNYQIPCTNWTPSCSSDQVPYVVGQTLCPVPYPNFETPQLNNNQSQSFCSGDLSLPNSCSIEKTREEKANIFEQFSASWHYKAIEKTEEKTHQADGMKLKNTKATSKIISSEIVNIPYKQQSQGNNNLTDSVPVKKFEPDVKKLGELGTYISADKLFRSSTKADEVLMNIVSWRPAEFESCFSKEVPCVLNPEKLPKTQLTYNNHEDYCKVQIPLILVHISYQIKNAYKVHNRRTMTFTKCEVVTSSASIIWIENTNSYMIGFNIKLYELAQSFQKPPELGDFLRIRITKGDTTFSTLIFGYVAKILNNKVERKSDTELVEMTFAVVTKLIDFNLYRSKIKEVSLIMSLLPSINLLKALDKVQESPVLPLILNPNPEDYELSPTNPDIEVLLETSSTPHLLMKENLNYKQLGAIRKIADVVIRQEPKVALIEGSPGSGKTEVITNTIIDIFNGVNGNEEKSRTMKILVCAVSDSEIDEILCRLHNKRKYWKKQKMLKMVRVGHLDEMSTQAKEFSLNELARKNVEYIFKELDAKDVTMYFGERLNQLRCQQMAMEEEMETKNNRNAVLWHAVLTTYLNIKRSGRNVADIYPNEYANLLEVAEHTILSGANVIICRLDMCYSPKMDLAFRDENLIPVLIIEEATQSIETEILKPLTFGVQMLILVADACKRSMKYSNFPILEGSGFNASLFERLKSRLEQSPDSPIINFHIQYRMNRKIAYFPNKFFFQGNVRNEVASEYSFPLVSYRVFNWNTSDNLQKSEEMFVTALVQCIMYHAELKNDSKPLKIGVITTSKNSKFHIMTAINDLLELISDARRNSVSIEVDTLENFRNKEFDAIFALCYRPKSGQRLDHAQKMYSVLTLAKHCLLLYGTFKKFDDESTSLWNCLIDDASKRNMLVDIEADPSISKLKMHILNYYIRFH